MMENEKELKGLGGWLVLVGIGLILNPIGILTGLVTIHLPIFRDNIWQELTTIGAENYHCLWGPVIIGEIVYNSLMLLFSLYLLYLYFSKHYRFPKFYISFLLVSAVFIPLDTCLASFLLCGEVVFDAENMRGIIKPISTAIVWIPYMLVSKRVKATFVENMPYDYTEMMQLSEEGVEMEENGDL